MAITTTGPWESRAVSRMIEAGSSAMCVHCDEQVKFRAKSKATQVICNVYAGGKWIRVEHFHSECYDAANAPYGEPAATNGPTRVTAASIAAQAARAAEAAQAAKAAPAEHTTSAA
jgi:hypothetical protein